MLLTPRLGNLGCLLERGAHRSAAFRLWIEPDWNFDGLVHQKQETTRVLTTDFGLVCHGLPPLFLASRELRLSHARGHRLESCRETIPRVQQRPSLLRHSQGRSEHGTLTA